MHPQITPAALRKRLLIFFIVFLACVLLIKVLSIPSVAQSSEERELEDKIPKHLPIKVKIKKEKEKAFKDLKNEKWIRDFELEVTNTGDKPIYFLDLTVVLPEITAPNGYTVMFGLHYGRIALGDIKTKAEPNDVPINPGETHVFSLTHKQEAWEVFKSKKNWQQPRKLRVKFQIMSFGDGTGFWGNEGMAVPHASDGTSSQEGCQPEPNLNNPGDRKARQVSWRNLPAMFLTDDLPANFLSSESSQSTS
jgi:hypothetical protein